MSGLEVVGIKVGTAVLGFVVSEFLKEVRANVMLLVKASKNFTALSILLTDLEGPVNIISKRRDGKTDAWLTRLEDKLQEAKVLVDKFKSQSMHFMHLKTAKKLVKITDGIKNLHGQAVIAGWSSNISNFEAINTQLSELMGCVRRQELSNVTKNVFTAFDKGLGIENTLIPSDALGEIKKQAGTASTSTSTSTSRSTPRAFTEKVFGGDQFVQKVKALLLTGHKSNWVGIWSMGGAGKTLTAQRAYKDHEVRSYFVGGTLWFDIGRDRERDVEKLHGSILEMMMMNEVRDPFLLVLDDVWSDPVLDCLDSIRSEFPDSKILVTTRNEELLGRAFDQKVAIPVLSDEDSWQLFCWHAFGGEPPQSLERIARQVAAECKGLPLALKVIGATMASKSREKQWEIDLKKLRNADPIGEKHEKDLFHRLHLSIDDLDQVQSDLPLRECFNYFAAFPEDHRMEIPHDLLSYWIGEGIVGTHGSKLSPEEEAYEALGLLIARSLIELHSEAAYIGINANLVCKIHDVLRDLVRYKLQGPQVHDRKCLYEPGLMLTDFPDLWTSCQQTPITSSPAARQPLSVQRLSLMYNDSEKLPSQQLLAPKLSILLLGHNLRLERLPKQFFADLFGLRVLDLKHTNVKELPAAVFRNLSSLVVLDLTNCIMLESIPDSIKYLTKLEELHLSWCEKLETLPDSIKFLQSLRELHLMACSSLTSIPRGLRSLINLQTLDLMATHVWDSRLRGAATLQDLNCLSRLANLSLISTRETSFPVTFNSLKRLTYLKVRFDELEDFPDLKTLTSLQSLQLNLSKLRMLPDPRALSSLQFLKLTLSRLTMLPPAIPALYKLTKIDLANCTKLTSLPALDELPRLELLNLNYCDELTILPESFGRQEAFPSLLELRMCHCRKCGFPTLHPGAMPKLSVLSLPEWYQLQQLPESFKVLKALRHLDLGGCRNLEDLGPALDSSSFPGLETLELEGTHFHRLPGNLASNPKLLKNTAGILQENPTWKPTQANHWGQLRS